MTKQAEEIPEVIDNLRRIVQAIREYSRNAEKETGLTGPQLWAIKILDCSAPLRVSELARRMYLHPATVVGIVDRLEAKELVSRNRSSTDRRVVELELTSQGRAMAAQAPEVAQGLLVDGLQGLSAADFSQVAQGMALVVRLLGAEQIPPQPLHG